MGCYTVLLQVKKQEAVMSFPSACNFIRYFPLNNDGGCVCMVIIGKLNIMNLIKFRIHSSRPRRGRSSAILSNGT